MAVAVIGSWLLFENFSSPGDGGVYHAAMVVDGAAPISKNSGAARIPGYSGGEDEIDWSGRAMLDSKDVLNLKFEKMVLKGGKISYARAERMLKSDEFKNYMQEALWQSQRDLEAARMTEIYARSIEKSFADDPAISIETLGCGISVCVGAITTYGAKGESKYSRFQQALSPADGTPAYSMIEVPIGEEGGAVEHRFVFATDPNMNAIGDAVPH